MVSIIENFCKNNGYILKNKSIFVGNIEITLIQFSIKKFFTKHYSIFIMEENDLNKIESVLKTITSDNQYNQEHILLICLTQLMVDKDKYCIYSGNDNQIIDCVYYNTIQKQYNYYIDMDTPKCYKKLIAYLIKSDI